MVPMAIDDWFLTAAERDNPFTRLDHRHGGVAWTSGNEARAAVHGANYSPGCVNSSRPSGPVTCCCSPTGAGTRTNGSAPTS